MKTIHTRRIACLTALAASSCATAAWGEILYSNMQGNVLAEQTASVVSNHGYRDATGRYNNDPDPNQMQTSGSAGVGDDYTLGYNGTPMTFYGVQDRYVQLNSLTVYGSASPGSQTPPGTWGTRLYFYFFNSQKQFLPLTISSDASFQGMGTHNFTFSPVWIPANGYMFIVPFEAAGVNLGQFPPVQTPYAYGTISYTGFLGTEPTVGVGKSGTYASINKDRVMNDPLNPAPGNSSAYMQLALGGVPSGGVLCDANNDGTVNSLDFNALSFNYGLTSGATLSQGDFDFDGKVNTVDFNLLAGCFGRSGTPAAGPTLGTVVPEPSSMMLLAAAMVAIAGRRRNVLQAI